MRFLPPLLVVWFYLTVVAAASGRADGLYFTEQFGVSAVGGELGRFFHGGFSLHLGFGAHVDGWALEADLDLNELDGRGLFAGAGYDAVSWGAGVRRLVPISPWMRLYARAGVEYTEISRSSWDGDGLGDEYGGRGLDLGAGAMVSGQIPLVGFLFAPLFFTDIGPKVSAGAWFDVGQRHLWLRKHRASDLDGFAHTWLLGFSLGGRF